MRNKARHILLFVAFALLCVCALAAGIMAIRFTQGTAVDGDGFLLILFGLCAIFNLSLIRILS